ncbi:MAG: ATP-binding protein [Candidatus Lokiarchaeota archaeon]|nr:ATP-binding protein [Candidatus Lokiarchaeota archaeon]
MEDALLGAIRTWNPWWAASWRFPSSWVPRTTLGDIIASMKVRHIKDIIGVRRCGKTTLVFQVIKGLIDDGIPPEQIVFLNFNDVVVKSTGFHELEKAIYVAAPDVMYLFLDEVQEKPGWQQWVVGFYDTSRFKHIFVTGSTASLITEDVGRLLTGRHLTFRLLPFSFREALVANGWDDFDPAAIKRSLPRINGYLERYLAQGGFPETHNSDPLVTRQILTLLFGDIIARDIASRHAVDVAKLTAVAQYTMTNFTREFSMRKIANALAVHVDTVEKYLAYLEQSFMVFTLPLFSYKQLRQFHENKKFYVVDNGLRNQVAFKTTRDLGKMAENVVFLALKQEGAEMYYWKDDKHEVDFLVTSGANVRSIIQVCWDPSEKGIREREIAGIVAAARLFGLPEGMILDRDAEAEETRDGITIHFVPIATWLLDPARAGRGLK